MERQAVKDQQAQRRRLERRMAAAEQEIAELEDTISDLEQQLCLEEIYTDFQKSAEISQRLETAKADLERTYDEWMQLQEQCGDGQ